MKIAGLEINKLKIHLMQFINRIFIRSRPLWVILLAVMFLSGCVNYELGINFDSPNQGELVQHIKLGEQLTSFNSATAQQWLESIEQRTRKLQGKVRRISKQELTVTIPFYTGAELEEKFNEFFNPTVKKRSKSAIKAEEELPQISSQFHLNQNNLIFFVRNRLIYDVDLRSLGVIANSGNVIISPGSLLDLEFGLNAPWGAKSIQTSENAIAPASNRGNQLLWQLQPGQVNHIEAVFWLPNPLGIGTLIIVLVVVAGFYLKYKRLPGTGTEIAGGAIAPQ